MIRTTPDELLVGGGHLLSLQGRVTLNLKKAALRLRNGPPKYLETVCNHLRAALAKHVSFLVLKAEEEIIRLGHVTANGGDRMYRVGRILEVVEAKAASRLGLHNLQNWLKARLVARKALQAYQDAIHDLYYFIEVYPRVLDLRAAYPHLFG